MKKNSMGFCRGVWCYSGVIWAVLLLLTFAVGSDVQEKPRIYSLRVYTDIKFHFATTLVTSKVLNPGPAPREAVFDVTLPNQAFISNFTLEIGGQVYPGQVREKEQAQRQYEAAKKRGQSAGQVKQKPRETNRFKVEINVGAGEKVTFNLTYQEVLERRLGVYEHVVYIDPGQTVEDLSVEVSIEENREITYLHVPPLRNDIVTDVDLTASHGDAQISRPDLNRAVVQYRPTTQDQSRQAQTGLSGLFTVRYDVDRKLDGGELLVVNGYFVHFFAPEVEEPVPKDVLFILDTSTSMNGEKIRQLKDAMRSVLNDMTEGDHFGIMEFNSKAAFWKRNLVPVTPKNIQRGFDYVSKRRASGWTNMDSALSEGLDFLNGQNSNRSSMVIFLTDGVPTAGDTNNDHILNNVRSRNGKEMPIYGLSFGQDADWPLVKKLTAQNNGVARRIYEESDSSLQIQGFYKEVSTMLLSKVNARYLDGSVDPASLTQSSFQNYFNGSEIVIAGKLLDSTAQSLVVNMEAFGSKGGVQLTSSASALDLSSLTSSGLMDLDDLAEITEKMWAYLTLKQALKQQVGEEDAEKKVELKNKAVELSLKYGFVTPVTSMVVTKPEEEGVGDLEEDDSDLQDDSVVSARRSAGGRRRGGGGGGGGGYSRGGGGGDPHFMVELKTLPYPLCFDVDGHSGEAFQLLRDPQQGLTVNMELGEGRRKRDHPLKHGSIYRVYIFKVAIILKDIVMEITRGLIKVNGEELHWNESRTVRMPGVWVMMSEEGGLRFVLDSGVEVDVKKKVHPANNTLGADFLDVEIEKEELLSKETDGLLGRFVHMKVTMTRMVVKGDKKIARLRNLSRGQRRHGSAFLKERKDPFFNRTTPCLNLRARGTKLLDRPTRDYKVRHLFYV